MVYWHQVAITTSLSTIPCRSLQRTAGSFAPTFSSTDRLNPQSKGFPTQSTTRAGLVIWSWWDSQISTRWSVHFKRWNPRILGRSMRWPSKSMTVWWCCKALQPSGWTRSSKTRRSQSLRITTKGTTLVENIGMRRKGEVGSDIQTWA